MDPLPSLTEPVPDDDEVIVQTWPTGARFYASSSSYIERELRVSGHWEGSFQQRLLTTMMRGGTFVDCGANIGVHACAVATWLGERGRVIAIEPVTALADRLQRNCSLNGLTNVQIVRAAVGKERGQRAFLAPTSDEDNQGGGSFYARGELHQTPIRVPVTTLDEIVDAAKCRDVRTIKLDVEGGELEVLRGAHRTLRTQQPYLFLEYNQSMWGAAGATLDALTRLLTNELGYRWRRLDEGSNQIFTIEAIPTEPPRPRRLWHRLRRET